MRYTIGRRGFLGMSAALVSATAAHAATEGDGKRIVVIGATARTADDLIPQAIWRGYDVVAVARRPNRIRFGQHPRLHIVEADVYDQAALESALSGKGDEVVISVYGPVVDPTVEVPETDLMSQGTINIINAMKKKGNTKLMVSSSMAVKRMQAAGYKPDTPKPTNVTAESGLWLYNLRGPYNDMLKMEELTKRSGLRYIVLRPGQLMVEPPRGGVRISVDDEPVPNQRVIMYADFASWILDQVQSDAYLGKTVSVYSDTPMSAVEGTNFETAVKTLRARKAQTDADLAEKAKRAKGQ